jgi:outer membrane murein-binding lipoprotein Lpp
MTQRVLVLSALLGGLALAGCGRQATLERPMARGDANTVAVAQADQSDPMTTPAAAQAQATRAAADRARRDANNSNSDPQAPQSTSELRRFEDAPVTPTRGAPLPGPANNDPNGAPPQGAIPDPYNHPQG